MAPESLRLESVLVVLIDLAEGPLSSVRSMPPAELRANAGALAEICALLKIPVLLARAPLPQGAAVVLPEITAHLPDAIEIGHETNDSWETPAFVEAVRAEPRRQLVFAGIATDVGVALTAISALRAGYQVAVLVDVCGTIGRRAEQAALGRLDSGGGDSHGLVCFCGRSPAQLQPGKGAPSPSGGVGPDFRGNADDSAGGRIMNQEERRQQGLRKLQEIAGDRAVDPMSDWNEIAPDMGGYIVEFVAGDILSRPGLDAKTRQLATVAMLAALGHAPDEFRMHLRGAVRLGWTREQLVEVLLQSAVFAGFPAALNALKVAAEVFAQNPKPTETD